MNEEVPRFPPRRAETLPVRFAEINRDDRETTSVRLGRERLAEDLPPQPSLSRRNSSFVEIREPQPPPKVVTSGRYKAVRRHRPNRRRHQRQDRLSSRHGTVGSDEDQRSDETDSSKTGSWESDYTSASDFERVRDREPKIRFDGDFEHEEERDVNDDAYTFSLPRYSQRPFSQNTTLVGSDPSLRTDINSEIQIAAAGSRLGTQLHVYHSAYTGEGAMGERHRAELTAIQDPKKRRSPLFRWR